jgi:Family of unknown function (DUF6093)
MSDDELAGIRADMEHVFGDEDNPDTDRVTIYRETAYSEPDPDTAEITTTTVNLHVDLRANISQVASRRDTMDDIGNATVFVRQYRMKVPYTVDDVQIRDFVLVTASRDPGLVGRKFEVRDVVHETNAAARLVTLQDVTE